MPPYLLRPAATDIEWWIIKGETYEIHVPVLDANRVQLPAAPGYTGLAQVRRSENEAVLHEWSAAENNLTMTTSGLLEAVLQVVGPVTALWAWVDAFVAVDVTDPAGDPHTIAEGPIHALPNRAH